MCSEYNIGITLNKERIVLELQSTVKRTKYLIFNKRHKAQDNHFGSVCVRPEMYHVFELIIVHRQRLTLLAR
jgi:hypothetical protein